MSPFIIERNHGKPTSLNDIPLWNVYPISYSIQVIAEYNMSDSKIICNQIILSTYRYHKLHRHPNTLSEATTKASVKPQSEAFPEAYTLHCPYH